MLFSDLILVIATLQKQFPCPQCRKKFNTEDITIVATLEIELLALVQCIKCKSENIVHAVMTTTPKRTTRLGRNPTEKVTRFSHRATSSDEILDMHNFLKGFNGDFQSLFSHSL